MAKRIKLLVTGLGHERIVERAYFDAFNKTRGLLVRGVKVRERKRPLSGEEAIAAYAGRVAHDVLCRDTPKIKSAQYVLSLILSNNSLVFYDSDQARVWAYAGLWERGDATRPPEFVTGEYLAEVTEHDDFKQLIARVLEQGLTPMRYSSKLAA